MGEYSVYVHTNRNNGKRYVGVTKQAPERRWQKGAGYDKTPFGEAVKQLGWDSFNHEVICSGLDKEHAFELEKALIREFRSNEPEYGYNVSDGGYADDCFPRCSGIDHWHHARVNMIDPNNGRILRTFDTQSQAAEALGISRKGITKACQGLCQTYKGFVWKYADKDFKKPIMNTRGNYPHTKQCKAVKMVDVDGTVYVFNSFKSASKFTGIHRNNISRYVMGLRTDQTGRRWCLA